MRGLGVDVISMSQDLPQTFLVRLYHLRQCPLTVRWTCPFDDVHEAEEVFVGLPMD